MRFLSTKIHAVMDYLVGALLIAAPWLLQFSEGGAEMWVPIVFGGAIISYSLLTDYEYSIVKSISLATHLTLDMWSGIFLAASPWIFRFHEVAYLPHLLLGVFQIAVALSTNRAPHTTAHSSSHGRHRHAQ